LEGGLRVAHPSPRNGLPSPMGVPVLTLLGREGCPQSTRASSSRYGKRGARQCPSRLHHSITPSLDHSITRSLHHSFFSHPPVTADTNASTPTSAYSIQVPRNRRCSVPTQIFAIAICDKGLVIQITLSFQQVRIPLNPKRMSVFIFCAHIWLPWTAT
jgi:hypothetical protein